MNLELFLCEHIQTSSNEFARLAILPFEPGWTVLNKRAVDLLLNAAEKTEPVTLHGQTYAHLYLTQESVNRMVNLLRNETGLAFAVCEQEVLSLLKNLPKAHTPLTSTSRRFENTPTELKEIWFHLTDTCNLRCKHCLFSEHLGKGRGLSRQVIFDTIQEACDLGTQLVVFTGGEPFAYSEFSNLLQDVLFKFSVKIAVLTNATLLDGHKEALSRLDRNRIHMQISLDGPAHIHDSIRGKGAFDATFRGIDLLKELEIPFSIATAINSANLTEMDALLDILVAKEIENLHLMWHFPRGKGANSSINPLKFDEFQAVVLPKILNLIKKAQERNISVDNLNAVSSQVFSPIGTAFGTGNGGWESLAIGPDGAVYFTPASVDVDFMRAGSLSDGLRHVWLNSPVMQQIRQISWQDVSGLINDPWHTILGTGDLDHMIQGEASNGMFLLKPDPYYAIYKAMAVMAITREIPQQRHMDNSTPGIVLRMGDVTSKCPSFADVNFTHCNCLLSVSSKDSQQLVAEFYTERAKRPDETIRNPVKLQSEALSFIPEEARVRMYGCGSPVMDAALQPGEDILDLGCGTGVECFLAAKEVGRTGRVYGLDMLNDMLQVADTAKQQVVRHLGYDNITFLKGDMEHITLPDESVNVVISNCVINLTRNKRQVFSEILRVLRPGGRLVISDVVTDREPRLSIRADHGLSGECIAGAMVQKYLFDVLKKIGFSYSEILKRFPYRKIQDHWFHSLTFRAFKPLTPSKTAQLIIYGGTSDALVLHHDLLFKGDIESLSETPPLTPQELATRGILMLNEEGAVTNSSADASCSCCIPEANNASCDCTDSIQEQKEPYHTNGCLICGSPIRYFQTGREMTCSICQRVFSANSCCENGHFVCDACHIMNPVEVIRRVCLLSRETDMLALMQAIRSHECFPVHGPEHHAMVPAIIVTTYRNMGADVVNEHILTAIERGSKVPGGACGYMGVCGAAIGVGIGFSILLQASPLKSVSRQKVQDMVSQVLQDIAKFQAARCCQRESYTALKAAERISSTILPMGLQAQTPLVCRQYMKNRECIGRACPLHKKETILQ